MRRLSAIVAAALFLVSNIAVAQVPYSFQFVPVVSKAQGANNTFWLSDLYITNVGSSTSTVGVKYFPSDVSNTFNGTFPKTLTIPPGQNFSVMDVIGSWFPSYYAPPTVPATKGYLIIADITPQNCNVSSPPSSYPGLFAVTSRTYNTGDVRGTFGMTIPPPMEGMNFTTYPSVITGVINTGSTAPGFRTNVSVANLSTRPITVRISAFKSDGSSAGTFQIKTILPLSFGQWSVAALGFSMGSLPGRIEVKLDPPSQVANPCTCVTNTFTTNPCSTGSHYALSSEPAFFAYASMTDNGTGDGTFLGPVIDYVTYSAWKSKYKDDNCPNLSCLRFTPVEEFLRARGLGLLEEAPVFRKVTK